MLSGFATKEFLRFSETSVEGDSFSGVMGLDGIEAFPYQIIEKRNPIFTADNQFIVSPICLSGASNFDPNSGLDAVLTAVGDVSVAGGFLQTRTPYQLDIDSLETKLCYSNLSTRTNYRLILGLSDEELLSEMKSDSRSRCRKLLKGAERYKIIEVDVKDLSHISKFSDIYSTTADRLNFSQAYRFDMSAFIDLLASNKWKLYLLRFDGELIAGSIVCKLDKGYDYTFMAGKNGFNDAGRANLLFLYKHLSQLGEGYIDLGGGIEEGDSLARFKLGFGASPESFLRLRFISKAFMGSQKKDAVYKRLAGHWP